MQSCVICVLLVMDFSMFNFNALSFSSHQMRHIFYYQLRDMTTFVTCICKEAGTVRDALAKCSFFGMSSMSGKHTRLTVGKTLWLPDNFPCTLMHRLRKDWGEIYLSVVPGPTLIIYPTRPIPYDIDIFTVQIYHASEHRILSVRPTNLTPRTLLVVVDPKKTIRESLKDDGRFSLEALEDCCTHLISSSTSKVVPVDLSGEVLRCNGVYNIHRKAPRGLLKK